MLDEHQPTGNDTSQYIDFDKYMIRLDPILDTCLVDLVKNSPII